MREGVIVVLSYPDTVVRPAYSEFSSKIWPFFGVGGNDAVQAGHASLLLIDKQIGIVDYFDFGRYITTFGFGRVRSKASDPELVVPIKATFENNQLMNLEELLLWLDKHPEKTHGEGRLVASVNDAIDYNKASAYIHQLISEKEIPYGAFVKKGTNCARFVTDTILNSCLDKKVKRKLTVSNLFTPSPIGNTIKGTTENYIFKVENQQISEYTNRSIIQEYSECFFKKIDKKPNRIGTEFPDTKSFELSNGTWLGGIGSGAWFGIVSEINGVYQIARYSSKGEKDFEGSFKVKSTSFEVDKACSFVYPTNCKEVFIEQNGTQFLFVKV